ncbi:Hsp20/alpha crystallin family protein [Clostridium niameyense]|uniref:Hsp20/alpha crystallin family protein n=1 Tax=Clostridium niameyense TaxID=1622073 RepID=A0A6M0RCD5_9CLOT|nr:heat shock protein Hsp18 [Clostridium niameyense]NEZ47884.1 Hsp20/alpha crystallin family protein [Clostridium niameyense]
MFDIVPFRRSNKLIRKNDAFDKFLSEIFNDDLFSLLNANSIETNFRVDLKETEDSYLIEGDLPGINKEDINIEFNNNYLTISAKREDSIENNNQNYVKRERRYGEFKRTFYIHNVDDTNITAKFNNGVLKLNLPKLEKNNSNIKRIEIQ